jgi:hypothetical protein
MQRRGLIVDDEEGVCELVGKVLNSAGIMASGSVARILGGNQMGIQLHQLTVSDSERLQNFCCH